MSELFALFLATSAANILAPGLGAVMAVSISLQHGWKKAVWGCVGLAFGIAVLFTIAVSGIGVIITSNPGLFAGIKLAGALYLVYLGVKTWRKDAGKTAGLLKHANHDDADTALSQFVKCTIVSITNPQPIVFGLSVLPQFIDPALAYVPQVSLMISVYALMVFSAMMLYAVLAERARRFLSGPSGPKRVNQATGVVFIAIALWVLWRTFG